MSANIVYKGVLAPIPAGAIMDAVRAPVNPNLYRTIDRQEGVSPMKIPSGVLFSIIGGLFMLVIAGLGWEISDLNATTKDLRKDTNSNNVNLISDSVRDQVIAINGRLDTLGAHLDGTNGRLDTLIQEMQRRRQR